ncbi:hypothetical protein CTAYLR_007986 [Chrysophaeum taylorii]|uniref:Major facilitator superfamily (MFS) profile domain-containing protein n=1 Tax=Chrysophaeum taylorii TaxID=2483200 RepID=A0AAD7XIA1_9STRA|nr:hypothetical protein CTAYLR_007986 [Chrysophaeum taylorii]
MGVRRMMGALVVAGSVSQASQYLLSFLFSVAPENGSKHSIRAALDLTPYLFSILVGYASGAPRALTQLIAGQIAGEILPPRSRRARALLLGGALATQALGTSLLGSSTSRSRLLCAQIIVGLGSGPLYPCGYSIISRAFDKRHLGTPNGLFSQTTYIGPAISSLCVLLARARGWRLACKVVAMALVSAAALVVAVTRDDDDDDHHLDALVAKKRKARDASKTSAAVLLVALAGGARYAAGYAVPSYVPYYFDEIFPSRAALFSTCNAAAIFACGSTSALLGGAAAQAVARRRCRPRDYLLVPVASCFFGGLFAALMFLARSFASAVVALFAMQLAGEAWLAGTVAGLRLCVDSDAALGAFYTVATFFGCLNLVLLGAAVDSSLLSLRGTMLLAVALPYLLAVCLLSAAAAFSGSPPTEEGGGEQPPGGGSGGGGGDDVLDDDDDDDDDDDVQGAEEGVKDQKKQHHKKKKKKKKEDPPTPPSDATPLLAPTNEAR